jgi:ABC-type dipeptide/oligopeptide/nickel transport system permease subunit
MSADVQTALGTAPREVVRPVADRVRSRRAALPRTLLASGVIFGLWLAITLVVPLAIGRGPEETSFATKLVPPHPEYLMGSDALGRDVLVRTAVALRYDLAIAVVLLPGYARGMRAAILAEKAKPYAEAARAMALSHARIILVHLVPNCVGPVATQMSMDVAVAIMIAAGLSFLGFGVQPPTPEWGLMINEGSSYIVSGEWWVTFFPGLAILSVVLGFFLLDDGLRRLRA